MRPDTILNAYVLARVKMSPSAVSNFSVVNMADFTRRGRQWIKFYKWLVAYFCRADAFATEVETLHQEIEMHRRNAENLTAERDEWKRRAYQLEELCEDRL